MRVTLGVDLIMNKNSKSVKIAHCPSSTTLFRMLTWVSSAGVGGLVHISAQSKQFLSVMFSVVLL